MSNEYLDIAMERIIKQEINTVLDKIRVEIEDTGAYEQETKGKTEFLSGLSYCLKIIDKYRKEK